MVCTNIFQWGPGAVVERSRLSRWSSFSETKCVFPALPMGFQIVGNLRDREEEG